MAERLLRLADDGQERAESAVSVSAGAADAGRIPALGADGKLHSSMLGALGGAVSKVFNRVGDVVAVVGDYAARHISNDSSVVGSTVKDALETLAALAASGGGTEGGKYVETLATASASYTITHGLNTTDVLFSVYETATGKEVSYIDRGRPTPNTVRIDFLSVQAANSLRIVVQGGVAAGPLTNPVAAPPDIASTGDPGTLGAYATATHTHGHGAQAGGTTHPTATTLVAGYLSASDKLKLNGVADGANVGPTIATTSPAAVLSPGSAAVLGAVTARAAREDHQHVMPAASGSVAGAMSAADYTKLLGVAVGATAGPAIATTAPAAVLSPGSAAVLGAITARAAREDHQHVMPAASGSVAGAMSSADYTKLLGVAAGATNTAAPPAGPAAAPPDISTTGYVGALVSTYARQDHYHGHGDIAGTATLNDHHTAATASVYGFQSPSNFVKAERLTLHTPDILLTRRDWNPCHNNSTVHERGYACFMWGGLAAVAVSSSSNRATASPRVRYSSNSGTLQMGGICTSVGCVYRAFPFRWYTRILWPTYGSAHTLFCGLTNVPATGNTVWGNQFNTLGLWRTNTYGSGYLFTCGGPSNTTNITMPALTEAIVGGGVDLMITADSSRADLYWRNAAGSSDDWTLGASQTNATYLPGTSTLLSCMHVVSTYGVASPVAAIEIAYTSLDSP